MNWKWIKAKYVFRRRDIRGVAAPLASATKDGVELRENLDQGVWNPGDDVSHYKLVEPDDFVIGLRSFQHGFSYSEVRGLVSPAYTVFRAVLSLDPRFYKFYFRSAEFVSRIANVAQGIRQGKTVDFEDFGNIEIPFPPVEEQRRIAEILDREASRLDNLIHLRGTQEVLVGEAVSSRVDGLFAAFEGSTLKFRRILRASPCYGVLVPNFSDEGVPLIRVSDLGHLCDGVDSLPKITAAQSFEYRRTLLVPGDVLLTVVGATIGRSDIVPEVAGGCNISRALARIRPLPNVSPEIIRSWSSSSQFRVQAALATGGAAAQPALNMGDLVSFNISLPTGGPELNALADELRSIRNWEQEMRSALSRQVARLRERRQAFITAAVTGQIDVTTARGAVA